MDTGKALRRRKGRAMWVIFLEAGLALLLLLVIVWASWPKRNPANDDDSE